MATRKTAEALALSTEIERQGATWRKRGYSRAFTPHKNAKRRGFYIDRIPPSLHAAIMRRARSERIAIRSLVLTFLGEWSGWTEAGLRRAAAIANAELETEIRTASKGPR